MVRQGLCGALYAAGRIKEAAESLLNIVNTVDYDIYMTWQWAVGEHSRMSPQVAFM